MHGGHASDAKTNPGVKKNTHTRLSLPLKNPKRLVFVHSIILCGSDFGSKGSDLGFTFRGLKKAVLQNTHFTDFLGFEIGRSCCWFFVGIVERKTP